MFCGPWSWAEFSPWHLELFLQLRYSFKESKNPFKLSKFIEICRNLSAKCKQNFVGNLVK
jgi:hypothetical protein